MDLARASSSGRVRAAAAVAALILALALTASDGRAAGGRYVVAGGTAAQREQVRLALDASAFDWSLVPETIDIRIVRGGDPRSQPGTIWLPARLLDTGEFAWAIVQHEYAHQIDYFLLDADARSTLMASLGGSAWCTATPSLSHSAYACERFASSVSWAFWPAPENAYRPAARSDEAGAVSAGRFRSLLVRLLAPPAAVRSLLLHPDGIRR